MKNFSDYLSESIRKQQTDPPAILTMRRKSVRMFPDGNRIAIYHVDKLNIDIPIPYNSMGWKSEE